VPAETVVVGDTPLDVAVAVATGARSLAVATGGYDVPTLQAAGADAVVPDLSDIQLVLEALGLD
jgi:phosphoglycolate phosphatase